jgi:DNA recombination protein RmuC
MLLWIAGLIALVLGLLIGFLIRNSSAGAEIAAARAETVAARAEKVPFDQRIAELGIDRDAARADLSRRDAEILRLTGENSQLSADLRNERQNSADKLALLENAKKALADQFQALAADILDQKSKTFSEGSQKQIGNLLDPLKTKIEEFKKKVEEAQSDSKTGVAKLEGLIGSLGNLNQQLSEQARNLTTALRGSSKAQGDWGEFILRDLLEKAGLREGEEYSFQQNFSGVPGDDGEKSARTDVILRFPGERNLVIDSKVSLVAYTDYVNADADDKRSAALKLHLASVRSHVTNLAKAGYHRLPGIETPDFVVMFVPIEPAFLLALQNDPDLWADAYRQGILLVGPTTLLYIIRIVHVLWQQEVQARSVRDVMDRGAELYDKFVGFVSDLEAVGKGIRAADSSYTNAIKKLSEGKGNLIRQVEMLKALGVRTTKALPRNLLEVAEVEEPVLALAAVADEGDQLEA